MILVRFGLRRGVGAALAVLFSIGVVAGGAGALAQDPGTDAAIQATQQAAQISAQAAQQANEQMQQAAQTAQQQMQQAQQAAMSSTNQAAGLPRVDRPQFLPKAGRYTAGTAVAIQDSNSKATIYYTTDGSKPTTTSAVYQRPIALGASIELRAVAKSPVFAESRVAKAKYVVR
jgi:hypothetical protein